MSLPHALLTSLLEQPCSGMDLARRFGRSIGFFWPATHQQIYKELGKPLKRRRGGAWPEAVLRGLACGGAGT